jgi:hypothetical protein
VAEGQVSLAGMSANERLAARGLTAAWEEAVRARDGGAMLLLLRRVAMPDAKRVVETVLADPAAYGF